MSGGGPAQGGPAAARAPGIPRLARRVLGAVALVAVALAAHHVFRVNARGPFYGDESGWIAAGNHYTELLLRGDFDPAHWRADFLRSWGRPNPHVAKLLLGAGLRLHPLGRPEDTEFRGVYDFSRLERWNELQGRVPPRGTLLRARDVNRISAVLGMVALFAAARAHAGLAAALVASALCLTHGWIVVPLGWAIADAPYNLFLLLSFWAGILLFGPAGAPATRARTSGAALLAGALGGLAASTKLTGLPLAGLYFAALAATLAATGRLRLARAGTCVGLFAAAAGVVVVALNPLLWPVAGGAGPLELPRLYLEWSEALGGRPAGFGGGRLREIHQVVFSGFASLPGEWLLFAFGAGAGALRLARSVRDRRPDPACAPLLYFATHYAFVLALLPVNEHRFYLPLVLAVKLVVATGVAELLSAALRVARGAIDRAGGGKPSVTAAPP